MTSSVVDPVPPPLPALGAGRWSRWSDRLNAILVREVQQAVKGRLFAVALLVAVLITVVIATTTIGRMRFSSEPGRRTFDAGLATLVPLVLFVVPMQAFQSMRLELRGGIVEQLLLSRLMPRTILFGKLQAAMVQFVMFVSVMAPLLATSYLLRGVDLPTIGVSLAFALVACLVATAFAVSSAAQGMLPALQPLANLAVAIGLGMATIATMSFVGSGAYARALGWMWSAGNMLPTSAAIVLLALSSTALSMLIAQSHLLHAFENRSTGFRLLLFACPPLAFGWMVTCLDRSHWDIAMPVLSCGLMLLGIGFAIFMTTEQRRLSVRVRAHVPRGAAMAFLASPFLPGRDRGLACYLLYVSLLTGFAWSAWPTTSARSMVLPAHVFVMIAVYGLGYLAVARWLRGLLPDTIGGNHVARFLVPMMVLGGCITPLLVDVFVHGEVDNWHWGHVLNPFWSIAKAVELDPDEWAGLVPILVTVTVVAVAVQLPAVLRGCREVLQAAAARRDPSTHG